MKWLMHPKRAMSSSVFRDLGVSLLLIITGALLGQMLNLSFTISGKEAVRISFGALPTLLGGILLGPLYGALIGGGGDLLGFFLNSYGEYVPWITLVSMLRGMLPGLLVRIAEDRKQKQMRILVIQVALPQLICSVLLMPLVLYSSFGVPMIGNILARLLAQTFTIPIYTAIIYTILKQWAFVKELKERERRGELQREALARLALDESMVGGEMLASFNKITREIAWTVHVERSSIWMFSDDMRKMCCLSLYEATKGEHSQGEALKADRFPNYFKALYSEGRISAVSAQIDPKTEELNESYLSPLGILSMLDVAIMKEGKLVGVVCLESIGRRREWLPDEESFVSTVASMIGQILVNMEYRKAAQEAAQAHQSLSAILDSIDAHIYVADFKTYELLFVNKSAQRVWGNVVGKKCWEALQKGQIGPCPFCNNDQLLDEKGAPIGMVKWEAQNTITGRWYECHDTALQWIDGSMVRLEMAADITEHKELEETLKYQLEVERLISHLSSTFINLPSDEIKEGIDYTLRKTGELFQVDGVYLLHYSSNGDLMDIYEWNTEGIEPKAQITEAIHLDAMPWLKEKVKALETILFRSLDDLPLEAKREREVFTSFSIESILAVPMISRNRHLGYMGFISVKEKEWLEKHIAMLRVVAEIISSAIVRQDAERALLESESRFRQMADNIEEVFWLISADTRKLLYVNAAYESIWGLSRKDLYQNFLSALLDSIVEEDKQTFLEAMEGLQEEKTLSLEYRILRPDSSLCWIYTRIFCVHDDKGAIIGHAGISVDITKQKSSQHEALQASRAKSEFLSIISHELRTPLHAILSYADLGIEESKDLELPELKNYFERILMSSNRLRYLINDLLDISRIEAGSLEYTFTSIDMVEMVQHSQSELSTLLESKEIQLTISKPLFAVFVKADRNRIMQVLRNLIHNAIKFSPRGSSIQVMFTKDEDHGSSLLTHIIDEGPGIPEEELELIFDKFVQSSKALYREKGTGLGLAISREIIKAHGGQIYGANEPEGGARFTFALPLS